MKRHLAPSLFALSLCALLGGAGAAHAQDVDAIVPAAVDSIVPRVASAPAASASDDVRIVPGDLAPVVRPAVALIARDVQMPSATTAPRDVALLQGRSWKMPTSRTLMIGGTALALVGLMAVQGDTGAIMALSGGGIAVYGLYLHYNR